LALNLHAQGVDPMIDFSDIDEIRRTIEHCNRLPVHIRHPYVGDLVHTAFSGTHQDAIKKGMAKHTADAKAAGVPERDLPWNVPYLPIDPADIGRGYEAVIRVNSQSGKGGVSYLLQTDYGLDLPRALQPEFSQVVQRMTDDSAREATSRDLWQLFEATYLSPGVDGRLALVSWSTRETAPGEHEFSCVLRAEDGTQTKYRGEGNGPLSAFTRALADAGMKVDILSYLEHGVITSGPDSPAVCYAQCCVDGVDAWGVGMDTSVLTASVRAVLAAVNRAS
jgi:2-isopropylmalate synthase